MLLAVLVLAIDQSSKSLALRALRPGEAVPVLGGFLRLSLVFNQGAAFGLRLGPSWHFAIFALLLGGLLLWLLRFSASGPLGLVLGGAAGNLLDRLRFGHVVDFIDFRVWPVFNLADIAITLGALWLAFALWRGGVSKPQMNTDGHR